ncbi:MAG: glycosyltransferase family 2 protein [Bacillota bacterium]|nr:glycosyltransferase family 2 protein [Bacillota bacterium]
MKKITAVIVNYNTKELLHGCLEHIERSTICGDIKIVVVDNGSGDSSVEMIRSRHPKIKVIALGYNMGFGRANNAALKGLDTPYALLVNSDCFLESDCAEKMLAFMEENSDAGAAGPKVLNADGTIQPSRRKFLTIYSALLHGFIGGLFPNNKKTREYMMAGFDHDSHAGVDWISGCCMMLRKAALESVGGGFDESYFMYIEDVDLCRMLHKKGWRVCYVPQARCVHLTGSSGGYESPLHIRAFHKSMWQYFKKFYGSSPKAALFPLVYLGIKLRLCTKLAANALKKRRRTA